MDDFMKAVVSYFSATPVWLVSLGCMFFAGRLLQIVFLGFTDKLKNFFSVQFALPIGAACSCLVLVVQNWANIINPSFTIELLEVKVLSSSLLSFSVVGIVALIVLPIREWRKRGTKKDGKES